MAIVDKQGIAGLFKPAWQSKSAARRLAAIPRLNPEDGGDQEILAHLAQDADETVSLTAIQRLDEPKILSHLARSVSGAPQQKAARERFRQIIGDGRFDEAQAAIACLRAVPESAAEFASFSSSETVRQEALAQVAPDQWLAILGQTPYTDTRHFIVQRLDTLEQLLDARKRIRGRDKNAERLLKDRIDAIRHAEQEQEQAEVEARRLIAQAEYLAGHDEVPNFVQRTNALFKEWSRLEDRINPALQEQFAAASKSLLARQAQLQQIEEVAAARADLLKSIKVAIDELRQLELDALIAQLPEIRQQLEAQVAAWSELDARHAADESSTRRYQDMLGLMRSAVDFAEQMAQTDAPQQVLQALRWPRQFGPLRAAEQLKDTLAAERQAEREREEQHQQNLSRLHKKIGTIGRLAKSGRLGPAHGICQAVEAELDHFAGREQEHLRERLDAARETLQQMDDWKRFATEPKYQQLCEAMEGLIASPLHPDALAGEIKSLQKQWKSLGRSAVSDQYWERFKAASDQAFAPCAEFFGERRELRTQNLAAREAHVVRMRELLEQTNWDNDPDYAEVLKQFRDISRDFQAIKDVERGPGAEQWQRFNDCRNAIQTRLKPEYDRNHATQQQLIDLMTALADAPPADDDMDRLKSLQARWKTIGITRSAQDKKAWKAFKKQGDRAFEKLQSVRQHKRDEQDAVLKQHQGLIKSIRALARDADKLAALNSEFEDLQQQHAALPALPEELPEKLKKGVERDFRKACSEIDAARERFHARQRQDQLDALRKKAALCQQLEAAELSEQDRAAVSEQWVQIELTDPELARRIETRRQAAAEARDLDAIAHARRLFCIQAEIRLDVSSPEEDRALRMQHQLEQMNQHGLGGARAGDGAQVAEQLEIDWLCMPGADAALQSELDARIRRCLEQAKTRQSS